MKFQTSVLILAALAAATPALAAPTIYLDQNATYQYINATAATQLGAPGANWYAPGYDTTGWSTGNGTFDNTTPTSSIFDNSSPANAGAPWGGVAQPIPAAFTQWDPGYDPFLRTTFTLSAPTDLTVWIAIDNGIGTAATNFENGTGVATGMYINGVYSTNVGLVNAEGHAFRWESVFNIPASYTVAGVNLFALQLEDHGGDTGFDMMITSQVGTDNPVFTTAPPPPPTGGTDIPEPLTLSLFGAGLAGATAMRRRRKN